jgi:hypothetical protein
MRANSTSHKFDQYQDLAVAPIFCRHETFHPRYGWLKKGVDRTSEIPDVFINEAAPVHLGVGKNMVRAIKYWCLAFKLVMERAEPGKLGRKCYPTEFGIKLLGDNGWDPYLENLTSLWVLHWKLLEPTCTAATWFYTFNQYKKVDISINDLHKGLTEWQVASFPAHTVANDSIVKDVNCLIRMYSQSHSGNKGEDTIDSPFTSLGLIFNGNDSKHYAFRIGPKPGLVADVIAFACLDFASRRKSTARTISISSLLYEDASPGVLFKLTESQLCDAIEEVARRVNGIYLSESAGIIQMGFYGEPEILAEQVLEKFFKG